MSEMNDNFDKFFRSEMHRLDPNFPKPSDDEDDEVGAIMDQGCERDFRVEGEADVPILGLGTNTRTCPDCTGYGSVSDNDMFPGTFVDKKCEMCGGTGELSAESGSAQPATYQQNEERTIYAVETNTRKARQALEMAIGSMNSHIVLLRDRCQELEKLLARCADDMEHEDRLESEEDGIDIINPLLNQIRRLLDPKGPTNE